MFKQKSPIKKTGFLFLIMAGLFLANISFTEAAEWTPITSLPGLPAGPVGLSDFIIVIYDFLLSAVGIAAMFMIVVGGFRYLTAAGNAAALSEAKDIIYSALYGLLLALCVWIIVSTINPDLIYLKEPGANPAHGDYSCMPSGATCNTCSGGDGCDPACPIAPAVGFDPDCDPTSPPMAIANCCYDVCDAISGGECPKRPLSCTDPTWPLNGDSKGNCKCVDGATVGLVPFVDCDAACRPNNCYVVDFRIGKANLDQSFYLPDDKSRAQKFAIYDGNTWDNAVEIIEGCNLYINAADYTTRFEDLTLLVIDNGHCTVAVGDEKFDGDCFANPAPPLMDILTPNGYYGPRPSAPDWLGCFLDDIIVLDAFWDTEATAGRCKRSENNSYITCPIRICAEYADGTQRSNTKYLKMTRP